MNSIYSWTDLGPSTLLLQSCQQASAEKAVSSTFFKKSLGRLYYYLYAHSA